MSSPATPAALDDEPLRGAGDEIGNDRVDGDAPAGDGDAGLPCRYEDRTKTASARLEVELERDGHLSDRAVRADGEDDRAGDIEDLAGRRRQVGRRAAQVASSTPLASSKPRNSLSSLRNTCSPFSMSIPASMQRRGIAIHWVGSVARPASRRERAPSGRRQNVLLDGRDHGHAVDALSRALRVEDRHDVGGDSAARRAPSSRSAGRRRSLQAEADTACLTPSPGSV